MTTSAFLRVQAHQFDTVIGFRTSRRGTGDEHHPFGVNSVFVYPASDPFAPVIRFLGEIDGIHAVGEREILTRSTICTWRDDPHGRFKARDRARHHATTG